MVEGQLRGWWPQRGRDVDGLAAIRLAGWTRCQAGVGGFVVAHGGFVGIA